MSEDSGVSVRTTGQRRVCICCSKEKALRYFPVSKKTKKRNKTCRRCYQKNACVHKKQKNRCRECDFVGHLKYIIETYIANTYKYHARKRNEPETYELPLINHLGIPIQEYIKYLEERFRDGMTWENFGEYWEIDHINPLRPKGIVLTNEQIKERLNYRNTQPLTKKENRIKSYLERSWMSRNNEIFVLVPVAPKRSKENTINT